ncbi:ABC transporter [Mangrovactinospora gilvigrisea]|uniref:ABC transporter n=1 Tax=Mangrovactinospora gilvigrisea TaxID=1428644 RepID=A0A1J7BB38_9ACTN|nr:ABC transporter ATP-binding protein [Mangrovactinospora gilvigrisea]OIV35903.1 ABC transporter [Mangrovactinospora gilvigrisea]
MTVAPPHPSSRSTVKSLLRLWPYVRPARWKLIGSTAATLAATVSGLVVPLVIQKVIDGPIAHRDGSALWPMALAVLGLGVAEAVFFWLRRTLTSRSMARVEAAIRRRLYTHLQEQPVAFHDKWQSGQLLSRASNDVSLIRMFLNFMLIFLIVNAATFGIGIGVLLVKQWLLGLIVLASSLPMLIFMIIFEQKYRVATRRSQDQAGDLATVVEESILGIRILKAFGRHRAMERRFSTLARELRGTELYKIRLLAVMWSGMILVPEATIAVLMVLGVHMVSSGTMTTGALVSFFSIVMYLRWPVLSMGFLLAGANDTAAAADRVFEVLDSENSVTDPEKPALPASRAANGADAGGLLRVEGVRFRHPDAPEGTPDLLRGIDLEVRPGETVALVGATGSGKTTLTSLVPRLYDVTGGGITLDGTDVRDLTRSQLRELVSVAFEEPILFSASVRENVILGYQQGTDAEVRRALKVAQAEFVLDLPWGLDTRIGEQGLNLSGGQRQRLALARAVVARPRFLVLDDPLSALDVHTEALVEEALRHVLATTTALVVAHRPSTVMLADRVALLEDGRITAVGTHSDLLASSAAYRHLLSSADLGGSRNEEREAVK